ncbi:MAG: hypothetical protein JSW27_12140 [Phycisphaerales bacterium]|nr:MAG: hypothetical protein JSW27_12140 [Phycisphaerales bacterium]
MFSRRIIGMTCAVVMCLAVAGQAQDPNAASAPSPADGAQWIKTEGVTLTWTVGVDAVLRNIYFGTDQAAVEARDASTQMRMMSLVTELALDPLEPATTYYWAVDEWSASGVTYPGAVWSFTTYDPEDGGAVAEYWSNMSLSGAPDVVTTVGEVNYDWGSADVPGENSPDVAIPVDGFSCRWTAELTVPTTGTYTLYQASDDGARLFLNGEVVAEGWYDRGTTEDATGPLELVAGETYVLVMEMYENGGGATAFLRWEGPDIPKQIIPQGALQIPQMAISPAPRVGATGVEANPTLSWMASEAAVAHDVYLGTDADLVAAGDDSVYLGRVEETSLQISDALAGDTEYYWKVDEVAADETVVPGQVWSFTVIPQVLTSPEAWAAAAMAAGPDYFATDVENGTYDIGTYSGEITYEFIVKSNPLETQASMALIGRLNFGDTRAGLKYEQWSNTGTYGATLFGVADYDYGVANNPGIPTHLTFVSSEEAGATALYVDGIYRGSVDAAITLAGQVGIGRAIREDGTFVDDFDGEIFGVAIYDRALSNGQIKVNADAYLLRGAGDVTNPGDEVLGVPNDGDWPGAETPDLVIDDNVNTKYLHFKGDFDPDAGPTGLQVTPVVGPTIVTELTLTTANDVPGRDPVAFELYGSNEGIDGPYTLIASGDIVDFAGEAEWPRFTQNETPITFDNDVAYTSYQLLFTAIRGPVGGSVNSMQIAEIELIGIPAPNVVFAEDFEGLPLGPNVDEALAGDAVWTKTAPEGWLIDDSGIPGVEDPATDGVTEWAGWSFADKAWWTETAGDQDRSLFTLGTGTVAIADPDEWDDADHAEGYFNSFLSTPIIDLAGAASDALQLRFASSWRPEFDSYYHQTANITVSFDGGEPVEVLLWESDSESPNYKPYATNEAVAIGILVPEGAQNMVVTFGLFDAGNDWWWAIDNVEVVYY